MSVLTMNVFDLISQQVAGGKLHHNQISDKAESVVLSPTPLLHHADETCHTILQHVKRMIITLEEGGVVLILDRGF